LGVFGQIFSGFVVLKFVIFCVENIFWEFVYFWDKKKEEEKRNRKKFVQVVWAYLVIFVEEFRGFCAHWKSNFCPNCQLNQS
jgi:hypothetical protein